MPQNLAKIMETIGKNAKAASEILACATTQQKNQALENAANAITRTRDFILAENQKDRIAAHEKGLSNALIDRLTLDAMRLEAMVAAIRQIAAFADPIGEIISEWDRPSGIHIQKMRTPLGVIGVIFESRPNVTADAAALCLKSGNAVILRSGSEAFHSASAIHKAIAQGIAEAGLPEHAVQLVPTRDRTAVHAMLRMVGLIDVIVPRGGKGLVELVQTEARIPVFAHLEGIVHLYLDKDADPKKALDVILNAKTRRPGICGALECLLVDRNYRILHGDEHIHALMQAGIEIRGDQAHQSIKGVIPAQPSDWGKEYLDRILAVREVSDLDEALLHIKTYHSQHTDGIITENTAQAEKFFKSLDSAILMWNASTQFSDGGEFGMGGEIGIATGKLHARGPVGIRELTSFRYLVKGNGTVRA